MSAGVGYLDASDVAHFAQLQRALAALSRSTIVFLDLLETS
jgi:hypothetical protein